MMRNREGMCYHAGFTVSLRETQHHWTGRGRRRRRNLSAMLLPISCFLSVKDYHPVFIACIMWTLGSPLDGYSESQILYSIKMHFIQIGKWLESQKPICSLATRKEGLAFQEGDWSSSGSGTIGAQSGLVIYRESWGGLRGLGSKEGLWGGIWGSKNVPKLLILQNYYYFFLCNVNVRQYHTQQSRLNRSYYICSSKILIKQ